EVAVLGFPGDLSKEKAEESSVTPYLLKQRPVFRPADNELHELAQRLNKATKITIFCGFGAIEAHPEIVALAGLLKSPVAYSFRGKMGIQYDNPYEVGMTGLLGLPSAFYAMHNATLLLLLGTDFPYKEFMPDDIEIIQVDKLAERRGRKAYVVMGLDGKNNDNLGLLLPLIEEKKDDAFLQKQLEKYQD